MSEKQQGNTLLRSRGPTELPPGSAGHQSTKPGRGVLEQSRLNEKPEESVKNPCGQGKCAPRCRPNTTFFVEVNAACCKVSLFDAVCRDYFRARLFEALVRHGAALHAYSLLTDSTLLLISAKSRWSLERLLSETQRAYLSYFNRRFDRQQHGRRSHSALCKLSGDRLVRTCHRYIERAPLQSRESSKLGDYPWSSYSANGFGQGARRVSEQNDRIEQRLQRHQAFTDYLPPERPLAAYRDFVSLPMDPVAERALANELRSRRWLEESAVYLGGV